MRRMFSILAAVLLAGMAMMPAIVAAGAQPATPGAGATGVGLPAATAWLLDQQQDDGGFAGFSGDSEAGVTVDAIIALAAAEQRGNDTGGAIDDAAHFLASGDTALVLAQTGTGQAAKLVLGLVAAGLAPDDIANVDSLMLLRQGADPETGIYGQGIYDHALVMLGLAATGRTIPEQAFDVLKEKQAPGGGWAFDGSTAEGAADSNTTALVVQALVASGHGDSPLITDARGYLLTTLVDDTGATFQPGENAIADANSTAMVMQAVLAVGDDPSSGAWGNLPAALAAFQNDDGAFYYNAGDTSDNLLSTVQAIPAAAGLPMPVTPVDAAATPMAMRPSIAMARAA